jgi:PEGA domain-containing protein
LGQECRIHTFGYSGENKKSVVAGRPAPAAADSIETHVSAASMPTGADIEVDGSVVGNTPSTINLPAGDHTVVVSGSGYKTWERKMKAQRGTVNLNLELEQQQEAKK